jgi:predicted RNA binding protein YcfA (HicA-like mRNA interferase family)
MSKVDKKLQAMKKNPRADWKMDDLKSLSNRYGINCRQRGTSHVTFTCPNGTMLTVPARKPIKPVYIKQFVELLETLNKENIL